MKLPSITKSSKLSEFEDLAAIKEKYSPFISHMEKVIEVRIFLKFSFHKTDIDDDFINDLEQEYAIQFLTKMEFFPSKENIKRILSSRPIEQCDFHLSIESIRNKQIKVVHIYPNNNNLKSLANKKEKIIACLSNEDFEKVISKNAVQVLNKKKKEDDVVKIQTREIQPETAMLFNKEIVNSILTKAKEDILDKQLYAQSNGMRINLSIERIREKYLNPNSCCILETKAEDMIGNQKGKFYNISKARKRNILNDERYQFQLLSIQKLNEGIEEVEKPINEPIEIIMKDVNYILDNFPIEDLVDMEKKQSFPNEQNNNNNIEILKSSKDLFQKIKTINKKEVIIVFKSLQTKEVYRIIGLCLNLVYWVVFGTLNRVQIDHVTRQYLYIKLLKEIQKVQSKFKNKKLCHKMFIPMLILVVRIECENVLNRKFQKLFDNKKTKNSALAKVNELITAIFDPHSYFNTFITIGSNAGKLKHKLSRSILPKYKKKTFATSNLLEQMFIIGDEDNRLNQIEQTGRLRYQSTALSPQEIQDTKDFIMNQKVQFFSDLLNRVNINLKKRNLEPIFTMKKQDEHPKNMEIKMNVDKDNIEINNLQTPRENERYVEEGLLKTSEDNN